MTRIGLAKKDGKSVRSEILSLANGDAKMALRLQNKYRNAVKNKPDLIKSLLNELKCEGVVLGQINKPIVEYISDTQFEKIKTEINNLVDKISSKIKKENQYLKERIDFLERDNLRLNNLLYAHNGSNHAVRFFRSGGGENALN